MSEARIVLIGSSGFVGSSLLKCLSASDNVVAPGEHEADLTDPVSLRGCIREGDVVVNAAGYANATDTTARGRALFQAVNVDGVRNLAAACGEARVRQLVHISSVAAMGQLSGEALTEEARGPLATPYAASKLEGERILAESRDRFPITILRPTSVFGEGRGLARTLCSAVARGVVPLPGGGRALIPFTYIENIAHAVKLTIGKDACYGRTFIAGDLQSYSLRDIVTELGDAIGIKPRIVAVPYGAAWLGVASLELMARMRGSSSVLDRSRLRTLSTSVSYSIAALQAATGYEPPFGLHQAAERIGNWYVSNRAQEAGSHG